MQTKRLLKISLGVGALLTLLSALAFLDNISVVVRWVAAFREFGGDATKMPATYSGILPAFDWAAVDYSCVSTFVPLLGFLLATLGVYRLLRGHRPADPEHFPFFRTYDQLNVAFGLIGTLWGIILIGYYNMETVTMANLMTCLHTALFSTLVAVVWVFVVDHPLLRPFLQKLAVQAAGEAPFSPEDEDAMQILEHLRYSAAALRETWDAERERLSGVADAAETAQSGLARLAETGTRAQAVFDALESRQADLQKHTAALADLVSALQTTQAKTLEQLGALAADNGALRAQLLAETSSSNDLRAKVADLGGTVSTLERQAKALEEDLARRKEEADRADALFREELTALTREKARLDAELGAASREAADNARRADRAEKLLDRVRSAFGGGSAE